MNELTYDEAVAFVHLKLRNRTLRICPFDGHGKMTTWLDPAVIEVRCVSMPCTVRSLQHALSRYKGRFINPPPNEYYTTVHDILGERTELSEQIEQEMMAHGRRLGMKGAFDGSSDRVS